MWNKENIEYFKYYIDECHENAQALYEDMSATGLSFGAIEAEGALRMVKTLRNQFYQTFDHLQKDD